MYYRLAKCSRCKLALLAHPQGILGCQHNQCEFVFALDMPGQIFAALSRLHSHEIF